MNDVARYRGPQDRNHIPLTAEQRFEILVLADSYRRQPDGTFTEGLNSTGRNAIAVKIREWFPDIPKCNSVAIRPDGDAVHFTGTEGGQFLSKEDNERAKCIMVEEENGSWSAHDKLKQLMAKYLGPLTNERGYSYIPETAYVVVIK